MVLIQIYYVILFQPVSPPSPPQPQPAAVPSTDLLGLDSAPAPAQPSVQSIFESPTTVPGMDAGFGAAPAVNNVGGGGGSLLVDVFGAPAVATNNVDQNALAAGSDENFKK